MCWILKLIKLLFAISSSSLYEKYHTLRIGIFQLHWRISLYCRWIRCMFYRLMPLKLVIKVLPHSPPPWYNFHGQPKIENISKLAFPSSGQKGAQILLKADDKSHQSYFYERPIWEQHFSISLVHLSIFRISLLRFLWGTC